MELFDSEKGVHAVEWKCQIVRFGRFFLVRAIREQLALLSTQIGPIQGIF
jgi:hypothetical protein